MEKYFLKNSAGVVGQKLSKHGFWNTDQRTFYFWVSKKLLCLLPSDNFEGMFFFPPCLSSDYNCSNWWNAISSSEVWRKRGISFIFLNLPDWFVPYEWKQAVKARVIIVFLLCFILILWEGASHIELTSALGKLHFKHFKSIFLLLYSNWFSLASCEGGKASVLKADVRIDILCIYANSALKNAVHKTVSLVELLESFLCWEKGKELSGPSADLCQWVESVETEKVLKLFLIAPAFSASIKNSVWASSLIMEFFLFA